MDMDDWAWNGNVISVGIELMCPNCGTHFSRYYSKKEEWVIQLVLHWLVMAHHIILFMQHHQDDHASNRKAGQHKKKILLQDKQTNCTLLELHDVSCAQENQIQYSCWNHCICNSSQDIAIVQAQQPSKLWFQLIHAPHWQLCLKNSWGEHQNDVWQQQRESTLLLDPRVPLRPLFPSSPFISKALGTNAEGRHIRQGQNVAGNEVEQDLPELGATTILEAY